MVEELVFHIGDAKTGTTSIQAALSDGAMSIKAMEILFTAPMNHIPLAEAIRKDDQTLIEKRWSAVASKIQKSDADIAVISAEDFQFVEPERFAQVVRRFFPEFEDRMRLISYVRPHIPRLASTFSERRKQGGFEGTMNQLLRRFEGNGFLDYAPRFSAWRAIYGEKLTVRPMVRDHLVANDVVLDFLDFLADGRQYELADIPQVNEALTTADLAAIQELRSVLRGSELMTNQIASTLGWNLAQMLSALPRPQKAEKVAVHRELAERMRDRYQGDAETMDRDFFGGEPVMADALANGVLSAIDEPQSIDPADYFDEDALRFIRGVGTMLKRIMEADPEFFWTAMRPEHLRRKRPVSSSMKKRLSRILS